MSKISLLAKLTINEGANADFEAALVALTEAAAEEAGLEIYAAHKDTSSDTTYWFYELYTDDAALGVHGKGDGMKAAMNALGSFLAGAPEITMLSPVVAKGLSF